MPLYEIDLSQKKTYYVACDDQLIYVEEYGCHDGIPAVFFHGGPGQGFSADKAGYFNPQWYRIILIDQRGCGQSLPQKNLENNTTQLLLNDADHIRHVLGIDKWVIAGNSWGAALALLYAEKYPEHVLALILRGTFLADAEEVFRDDSFAARSKPDAWLRFKEQTHELLVTYLIDETLFKDTPLTDRYTAIYYYLFMHHTFSVRQQAAAVMRSWINQIIALTPWMESDTLPDEAQVNAATIEFHYSKHHYFLEPHFILNNLETIAHYKIHVYLIHGTKDLMCSPSNADAIQQRLPVELVMRYDVLAGHTAEVATVESTISATNSIYIELLPSLQDQAVFPTFL